MENLFIFYFMYSIGVCKGGWECQSCVMFRTGWEGRHVFCVRVGRNVCNVLCLLSIILFIDRLTSTTSVVIEKTKLFLDSLKSKNADHRE